MKRAAHSGNHHQSFTRSNGKSGHAGNGKNGGGGAQAVRHKSLNAPDSEGTRGAKIGVVEYFRQGDRQAVEIVLAELRALKVADLRTLVSWADFDTDEGEAWYSWLLPRLAAEVNVIPCALYTPAAQAVAQRESAPPWDPKAYGDFIDVLITRLGRCFEWIELWNEPDRMGEWDRTLDPHTAIPAECALTDAAAAA